MRKMALMHGMFTPEFEEDRKTVFLAES